MYDNLKQPENFCCPCQVSYSSQRRRDIVWLDILIGFLKFLSTDAFLRVDFALDFKSVVYLIASYKNLLS